MRNWLLYILFIVLAIVAYYFYTNDTQGSKQEDFRDFSIGDTSSVHRIFISNINGKYVSLNRSNEGWKINDKYLARPDAIGLLLKTIHDIKVKAPVSKNKIETVIRRMAANSVQVQYYNEKGDLIKTWYIGDPTPSKVGTYMLLEKDGIKSSKAYVTHLLAEKGSLRSRFFLDSLLWRDRIMLKTNPQKIKSIEVIHSVDTNISFKIVNNNNVFTAENYENNEKTNLPAEIAIPYFKKFKGIYYEYLDSRTPDTIIDSIKNSMARHILTIEMLDGKTHVFKSYFMPVRAGATMDNGEPINYNPERMYAYSSEMESTVNPIVQNLTFDPLVPSFKAFTQSTNVDK